MVRYLLVLLPGCLAATAHAGGHFDVDDAGTLDPGQCQVEAWAGRFGVDRVLDYHLGPACGIGPVEVRLNIDRYAVPGEFAYVVGPQVKWTFVGRDEEARFAMAASAGPNFDVTRGGRTGGQVLLPVSWRALDSLWLHANLGLDWAPGTGERTGRGGAQAEWAMNDRFTLIVERFRSVGVWTSRGGLRISLAPTTSVDLSGARNGPERVRGYAIGINHEFKGF